jgi:transposase InsO family protein
MEKTPSKTKLASAEIELDKALRPLYTEELGFPGAAALHAQLPRGTASLARVRAWVATQKVGAYLQVKPPPIQYARFDETRPNRIHQSDVLFLPHDKVGKQTYKYCLTLVDVASRFKAARALKTKDAATVARELASIYDDAKCPLAWPEQMMVDLGTEFKGATTAALESHGVLIRRADKGHHRSQAFAESFNKILAQRLFRSMYHRGFEDGAPSNAWVSKLQKVVASLNNTKTRMIGMKPVDAIKLGHVVSVPLVLSGRRRKTPVPPLPVGALVHVATNEEAKSVDEKRRATDPWWTTKTHAIARRIDKPGQESLYYFAPEAGQGKHGYTRSQLRPA